LQKAEGNEEAGRAPPAAAHIRSVDRRAREEADEVAVDEAVEAVGNVLGILEIGLRESKFGFTVARFENHVVGHRELIGDSNVCGLEHDAVDDDEIGVVHRVGQFERHDVVTFDWRDRAERRPFS
jgi:hypothetical protein